MGRPASARRFTEAGGGSDGGAYTDPSNQRPANPAGEGASGTRPHRQDALSAALIDDEQYRRRILVQLNRGEGRHQLARIVFHGKRGELRQRYREGQEDQLGALGIVVNLVVLWNTICMDAALDQLRAEGHEVLPEDIAHLSPLGFKHINMLGRYAFTLPEAVTRGEFRPLRNPATAAIDEP